MASPVYTVLLGEQVGSAGGTGLLVPTPPAGFRYVVTDIEAREYTGPSIIPLSGFELYDDAGAAVWALATFAFRQVHYHWRGRQVLDVGDNLFWASGDSGWTWRATGFQLSLP